MNGRKWRGLAVAVVAAAAMMLCAAPAGADEPGCERVPILGLNPQIRSICDGPIMADGSWARARRFSHPQFVHSSCFGVYYQGGCPYWANDAIPAGEGPIETYMVTPDTIPPGEPGHLG